MIKIVLNIYIDVNWNCLNIYFTDKSSFVTGGSEGSNGSGGQGSVHALALAAGLALAAAKAYSERER